MGGKCFRDASSQEVWTQPLVRCIEGVAIVALIILEDFFENDWVRIAGWQQGEVFERYSIPFDNNKMEVGHVLDEYFLDPPQLRDIKRTPHRGAAAGVKNIWQGLDSRGSAAFS